MKFDRIAAAVLGGGMVLAAAGAASAGGFSRGSADTDILFEPDNFAARFGVTVVSPTREYTANANPALVGTSYTDTYVVPSIAFKARLFDPLSCAGTYAQPYGGNVSYDAPTISGKLNEDFRIDELGLTCAVKFQAGKGNFYLLGGAFYEHFTYDRRNAIPAAFGGGFADLELSGEDTGYRIGAAYDIPEIAFRASVMYRAATSYGADGTLTVPAVLVGGPPGSRVALPAVGSGNLPQSLEIDLQSGIAPGWLAFASVKWTDWSVQNALVVDAPGGSFDSRDIYNWKDGWTVTGGVGHAFNDRLSGLVSLTWDQGVGTGWDLSSDTYTLAVGGSYDFDNGGQLRGGVGLAYLTSAEETQYAVNSAVESGYAIAISGGYQINW